VTARTFEDSAGAVWEVFEVQRTPRQTVGVSAGLEQGWLSFVSGAARRRLAPVPADWQTIPTSELARLCASARAVPLTESVAWSRQALRATRRPERYDSGVARRVAEPDATPPASHDAPPLDTATDATDAREVAETVLDFARQARARGLQAIAAMVELKALLSGKYPEPGSAARDVRRVRRWFVDAYYFDRSTRDQ
jgi:hypothetical protein